MAVYKISGHQGILTPKIVGGLLDFSTWESARLPCFTPSVHRFMALSPDAHRFSLTTRFNDMVIRWISTFVSLICTLIVGVTHKQRLRQKQGPNTKREGF